MAYPIRQLIEGHDFPVCVCRFESVAHALDLMMKYDYSQLPVIMQEGDFHIIPHKGKIITYEGILRAITILKTKVDDLRVFDVLLDVPVFYEDEELFDILDRLKETNAGLIINNPDGQNLVGIVTSYDTSEYFRDYAEDLMHVENIEFMVKEFIKIAFSDGNSVLRQSELNDAIEKVCASNTTNQIKKGFEDLTLDEYIRILVRKETWPALANVFSIPRENVNDLLKGIRDIRNSLAHFRDDIAPDQRRSLKYCADWLNRCQEIYQNQKQVRIPETVVQLGEVVIKASSPEVIQSKIEPMEIKVSDEVHPNDSPIIKPSGSGGRYAELADWLQSQPGNIDEVPLSFTQVEEIIHSELPPSARNYRAWWANDAVGHTHSQLWMDAGWRTTYINLSEGKVTFTRIREREKAYIDFFTKLLDEMRRKKGFPVRNVKPDGANWIEMLSIPRGGPSGGLFSFSFSRYNRFRVELYLDLGDQNQTKAVFDKLYSQKDQIETELGTIEWERLNNRRASRIALYQEGQIMDDSNHAELIQWAADTMVKLYHVILTPAEEAIHEVWKG